VFFVLTGLVMMAAGIIGLVGGIFGVLAGKLDVIGLPISACLVAVGGIAAVHGFRALFVNGSV
jgi:hypothetical protein